MHNSLTQPFSEADHVSLTFQINFDGILCNNLEKYYSCPGFCLRLGSIMRLRNTPGLFYHFPGIFLGIFASSYLAHQPVEGEILDAIYSCHGYTNGTQDFFAYFAELLEDPGRSGTASFDQQRYATAAGECLQLYLYNHHSFSMGATESALRDKALRRHKPSAWIARLGVHSRIRKGRNYVEARQGKFFKHRSIEEHPSSFPETSPEREYCLFLSYRWALDLLPFLLEKSAITFELAKVLRCCTFAMMAQRFSRRMKFAEKAIARYLARVKSAERNP